MSKKTFTDLEMLDLSKNKYVKNIVNWLGLIALLGVISHRNDNWIWLFVQLLFLPIIISVASNVYLPRYLEKMIMILSGCTFEIFIFQDVIFSDPFINKVRMIEGNGSKFYYFIICKFILIHSQGSSRSPNTNFIPTAINLISVIDITFIHRPLFLF